jgi:uridylate kinase
VYRRILLKLSGEALQGASSAGIDPDVLLNISSEIRDLAQLPVQLGIVVGGGNISRGREALKGLHSITADHMGILGTVINALALREILESIGVPTRVMSAIAIPSMVESFNRDKAIRFLRKNRVVIFAGGTGNPLFTTDSAASLRAIEIGADVLLKGTNVDGIYSADPKCDKTATLYSRLTYDEALQRELRVMDISAFAQCRDAHLPIRVFNINKQGALLRIAQGADEGTLVCQP